MDIKIRDIRLLPDRYGFRHKQFIHSRIDIQKLHALRRGFEGSIPLYILYEIVFKEVNKIFL
jgi:hypothetical protein